MKQLSLVLLFSLFVYGAQEYPYIQPLAVEIAPHSTAVEENTSVVAPKSQQTPPPKKETPKKPETFADADKDGVEDDKDQCQNTVAGAQVKTNGCEVDSDGDGVKDSADRCPDTSKEFLTDGFGCPQTATLELYFPPNSAEISEQLIDDLKSFSKFLVENPGYQVVIYGHTDSIGDAAFNKQLSQKRANATKKVLERYGIKSTRLTAIGKGEEEPVADNMYEEGRAKNRRIEVELIY